MKKRAKKVALHPPATSHTFFGPLPTPKSTKHATTIFLNSTLLFLFSALHQLLSPREHPLPPLGATMFRRKNAAHIEEKSDPRLSEQKVKELREALGPLSGCLLQYCNDACLIRCLESRNGNLDKAKKMLQETLKWRSSFRPEDIRWRDVAMEGETGKLFRANFHDRHGRTVLILRPGMQNTKAMEGQIKHLVYNIENAIFNLPEGQEQMVWLIDFTGWSVTNSVPVKTTRDTINILQNHYPERLGIAFLYNPPHIFESFWRIVKYFFDAKTIQKVKFVYPKDKESVEVMKTYFDLDNLPTEFGGKASLSYDHVDFSKLMAIDDAKYMEYWGLNAHPVNGHAGAVVSPEPVSTPSESLANVSELD